MLLFAALGFLFPRATIGGWFSPFGLGVAGAVAGRGSALVSMTVSAGYLLLSGTAVPFSYVTAVLLIGGLRWTLSAFPRVIDNPWYAPVSTFLSTVGVGVFVGFSFGNPLHTAALAVSEGLAAAGCAAVLRYLTVALPDDREDLVGMLHRVAVMLSIAVSFTALGDLEWAGIAPARMAAGMLILLMADSGRERGGAITGIVLGMAVVAADPAHWPSAAVFAFGGLLAGLCARFGRVAVIAGWLVCSVLTVLNGDPAGVLAIGIYEALSSAILFAALPRRYERRLADALFGTYSTASVEGFRRAVTVRLDAASRAMEEVSAAVDTVSRRLSETSCGDLGTLYRDAADDVCHTCERRMVCWRAGFGDAMDSLNALTPVLRRDGAVTAGAIEGYLARHCPRLDALCAAISGRFTDYRVRELGSQRLAEIRTAVQNQFSGVSGVFTDVATELAGVRRVDAALAARIAAVCEKHRLPLADAVCLIGQGGRMTVELLFNDTFVRTDRVGWPAEIAAICGKTFSRPITSPLSDGVKVTLMEAPRFIAEVGASSVTCVGESACGDAYEMFTDPEGKLWAVLSDGMGSGGRAAVDGALAAGLTARMLRGGFSIGSIVKILNAALMVKSPDETSATLDVLELDLFSGNLRLTKAGACSSLLVSGGKVCRIAGDSLPIGILQQTLYEQTDERMAAGDLLIMMTDGADPEGDDWLETCLPAMIEQAESMDALAAAITARAEERQEHRDDITVLTVKLESRRASS